MSLTLDDNTAGYQIRAYTPGLIQINDTSFDHSLIVSAQKLITDWSPQTLAELTALDLKIAANLKPLILLLGTGSQLVFPAMDIYGSLLNDGIGVEIMDTHAACRTFNVLSAEGRNVVAALLIR